MKKRLVIVDKDSIIDQIKASILPTLDCEPDFLCTSSIGFSRYPLKKISFSEVPYSDAPTEKTHQYPKPPIYIPYYLNGSKPILTLSNGKSVGVSNDDIDLEGQIKAIFDSINREITSYDEVVYFGNSNHAACWEFQNTLGFLKIPESVPIYFVALKSFERNEMINSWDSKVVWGTSKYRMKILEEQRIKKYFDYWWNTNSSVVFSEILAYVGLGCNPVLSKFELMAMAVMGRYENPILEVTLRRDMNYWCGSGRYKGESSIGSRTSAHLIVEQMKERGFIEVVGERAIVVSDKGRKFLSMLHPKTFDPDLGHRIANWKETRDIESVKRYIRTVFGKQLRFQRKQMGRGQLLDD